MSPCILHILTYINVGMNIGLLYECLKIIHLNILKMSSYNRFRCLEHNNYLPK